MSTRAQRDKVTPGYRIDGPLRDAVAKAAAERGLPANFLVEHALREFLDNLIPADEFSLTRKDRP
jgi:hypothetical protein